MKPERQRLIWSWFNERLLLIWPFIVALGMIGFSAQRLAPMVHENGVRTRTLDRLNREVESLQHRLQTAADDSVASRAVAAQAEILAGESAVRAWLQAVNDEAPRAGFGCDHKIGLGIRWCENLKVDVVEVALELRARAGFKSDVSSSARLADFLHSIAARPEWVEFSELMLRGTGNGVTFAELKFRLWVAIPES